jgi:hypothetical protein
VSKIAINAVRVPAGRLLRKPPTTGASEIERLDPEGREIFELQEKHAAINSVPVVLRRNPEQALSLPLTLARRLPFNGKGRFQSARKRDKQLDCCTNNG